jgi:hypothetical protein
MDKYFRANKLFIKKMRMSKNEPYEENITVSVIVFSAFRRKL